MAADESKITSTQGPSEFFESIGDRVETLAPAADGADGADQDGFRPVDEIESLCMNCGKNVRRSIAPRLDDRI